MKKTLLALCCLAALISCKKNEGPAGPQGPAGPAGPSGNNGTGIITGNVTQYDQYLVKYTSGLNTATVTIDGTNITAVTNAAGSYSLTNIAAGVYDLVFSKVGCGLTKTQQVVCPGAGTLYQSNSLTDKPSYTFLSGVVKDTVMSSMDLIKIKIYHAADPKNRYAITIIGDNANLDLGNPASYKQSIVFSINANSTSSSINTGYETQLVNNYPSGTILYAKVYPYSNGSYYDFLSGDNVYTGYGTPLPTTFTLTMP